MKTATYFPISTTHYSSTLSLNIRRTKGWQGYGQYIAILQMLANTKRRKLQLSEVSDIAFNLHISEEEVLNIINSYFIVEGNEFTSAELEEALLFFDAKYNAASEAGKKSAAMLTPEQRKEKAKKAIKTRWNKKDDTNTLVSDTNPQNDLSINNEVKPLVKNNTNTLVSVSIDTNKPQYNTNNKIEENRIEENRIEEKRKEENKIEQNQKEENKTEEKMVLDSESKFSISWDRIKNNEFLKSNYFGENINTKLVNLYLSQSNAIKSTLTYLQFEKVYILILVNIFNKIQKPINRQILVNLLNNDFNYYSNVVIQTIPTLDLDRFKVNEIKLNTKLDNYKL